MKAEDAKLEIVAAEKRAQSDPDPDNFIQELIVLVSDAYAAVKRIMSVGRRILDFVQNLFPQKK